MYGRFTFHTPISRRVVPSTGDEVESFARRVEDAVSPEVAV